MNGAAVPHTSSGKRRRKGLLTAHQSAVLHALFSETRFPTSAMREDVGRSTGLSARRVQIWFQDQRQKGRRRQDKIGSGASPSVPSVNDPPLDLPPHNGASGSTLQRNDRESQSPQRSRSNSLQSGRSTSCSFISQTRSLGHRRSEFRIGDDDDECLPDLSGQIAREAAHPVAGGGYADVWKGLWTSGQLQYSVAVKVPRVFLSDDDISARIKDRRLRREIRTWTRFDHPNVVPLFGVSYDFGPFAAMVSPWHSKGNLSAFLDHEYPKLSNRDWLRMVTEITSGLNYLHANDIIHGDLTGANVLLSEEETCCLCDFGLSVLLEELLGGNASSIRGAVRWSAPELYRIDWDEGVPRRSTRNDIFSLGSIILQVVSGKMPYHGENDFSALTKLANGILPSPPSGMRLPSPYQDVMSHCWAFVPNARPTTTRILQYLFHIRESEETGSNIMSCSVFWANHKATDSLNIRSRSLSVSSDHQHPMSYNPSPSPSPSPFNSDSSHGQHRRKFFASPSPQPEPAQARKRRRVASDSLNSYRLPDGIEDLARSHRTSDS